MITPPSNVNSSWSSLSRTPATATRGSVGLVGEINPRTVDQVENNASVGVELPQREESQQAKQLEALKDQDMVKEATQIIAQKTALRSSIAVLKVNNTMVGTLLDVVG